MQTWLITGCSSGLGRGFAKAVLKSGDQVIVTARRVETFERLGGCLSRASPCPVP